MKKIAILGISGSIGKQAVDVIKNNPQSFDLIGFSVGSNVEYANELLEIFPHIQIVSVQNKNDEEKINFHNVKSGEEGLKAVATIKEADVILTAVVGSVGLVPTIEAIKAKKDIALANKETLVTAGHLVMPLAKENKVKILPVDSEHSAIFQALNGETNNKIKKIILTASGGSFRDKTKEELEDVTLESALNHPNWSMGAKITIDSATMVNKGLEVIEAHHLFNVDYKDIEVVIHPESIIHSAIEFEDNSVIAQLGTPDMRLPIQYALTFPQRKKIANSQRLNLFEIGTLNFKEVDYNKYEGLQIAIDCGSQGGSLPTVFNAANEEAVNLFLQQKIKYLEIIKIIKKALKEHQYQENPNLEEVLKIDKEVRIKIRKEYL